MIYFATGWRYYWRRWLGWLPLQFCMVCGKPYWGGLPSVRLRALRLEVQWLPWWKEYCSLKCCHQDRPPGVMEQLRAMPPLTDTRPLDLRKLMDDLYAIKKTQPTWCVGWDIGDDYSAMISYWKYHDGSIEIVFEDFEDHRPIYEQWVSKHPLAP